MAFLIEYGLFLAKVATVLVALLVFLGFIFANVQRGRPDHEGQIEVKSLNDRFEDLSLGLANSLLDPFAQKMARKEEKKRRKAEDKAAKIESPGGVVHGYGLAASQLARIRDKNIQLTVSVDMVAASGGYMMACIANRIIAAPFALVGSVGVLAQIPNFSRLLKKNDIDVELHTAGEYKRTLTMFGENTEAGREKFRQELEEVHTLFKEFVAEHRPQVELEKIATGEAWYGKRAIDLALIDELMTSDEYLLKASQHAKVFEVKFKRPQKPIDKLLQRAARLFSERSMAYQPLLRHETEVRRGL